MINASIKVFFSLPWPALAMWRKKETPGMGGGHLVIWRPPKNWPSQTRSWFYLLSAAGQCVLVSVTRFSTFFSKPSEVTDGPEFGPLRTNVVASMKTSTEFPRWPLAGPESFNYPKEAKQCECKTVTHVGSSRCVKILL